MASCFLLRDRAGTARKQKGSEIREGTQPEQGTSPDRFSCDQKKQNAVIKNEIGDFFLRNNLFEYKSPGDSIDGGTFYKALAYACLYKDEMVHGAAAKDAGETFNMDTTITLVREQKPVKLLQQLREHYEVTQRSDGIYRIHGMLFPMQILVTRELDEKSHVFLTYCADTHYEQGTGTQAFRQSLKTKRQ